MNNSIFMTLPKSISPNPLFISTIELRFLTSLNRLELFQKMFEKFSKTLPNIQESKIPHEVKLKDDKFKYVPDYTFKNDDFSLSFGTKSIVFENVSDYKLWPVYSAFVKDCLTEIFALDFILNIERCGVRYGSIFDKVTDANIALREIPSMQINGLSSALDAFKAFYKNEDNRLYLQLSPNAKIKKNEITRIGLYIDIDASFVKVIKPNEDVFSILDKLHNDQKKLFFGLLKDEFIETLNPKYS